MKTAAVIPAAGKPNNTKKFRPLMCMGSDMHTLLELQISSLYEAGVDEIVVVTGYKSELVNQVLADLPVIIISNQDYRHTDMFFSVRLGLSALKGRCEKVLIMPADLPMIRKDTLQNIIGSTADVCIPSFNGVNGHPVAISESVAEQLAGMEGSLKSAFSELGIQPEILEVDDEGILLNADSLENFRKIITRHQNSSIRNQIHFQVNLSVGKGGRNITFENIQLLRMIDSTGSIQDGCAAMNMSYTKGWNLINQMEKELGLNLIIRSSGGTKGGGSTLTQSGKILVSSFLRAQEILQNSADQISKDLCDQYHLTETEDSGNIRLQ